MYEKVGMSGKTVTFDGPVADIDVRFPFHSSTVKAGRWEICTRNNFKGACMDVDAGSEIVSLKKEFGFFARVRSVRPIREAARENVSGSANVQEVTREPEIINAPAPQAETDFSGASVRADNTHPIASAEAVLRGHNAHFFKTPMLDGEAIDAGDKGAARDFCREAGFDKVEFADPVFSGGRRVIGDLLCAEPVGNP